MSGIPLASDLPLPQIPMSPFMRTVVSLRLTGFGYKRIARTLRITRDEARSYARAAGLDGVRGDVPQRRPTPSLADGQGVEILNVIDDHSRLLVASVAFATVKAADVVAVFHDAAAAYGYPETLLSDNAAVFSGASRKGKVLLETELERLGIRASHATPYHPQTCGKVERLHQSLKRYLARQVEPESLAHLQLQLDSFRAYYNQQRPHRALDGRAPLVAWSARLRATPQGHGAAVHYRVRQDRVGSNGTVTLRYESKLRHIPVGSAHKHQAVRLLIAGANVRIVRDDGLLLRELTIDPRSDYQPLKSSAMT